MEGDATWKRRRMKRVNNHAIFMKEGRDQINYENPANIYLRFASLITCDQILASNHLRVIDPPPTVRSQTNLHLRNSDYSSNVCSILVFRALDYGSQSTPQSLINQQNRLIHHKYPKLTRINPRHGPHHTGNLSPLHYSQKESS